MTKIARSLRGGRFSEIPAWLWEPITGGSILMVPLAFAFAVNRIWLFPSLGPTAYLQAVTPDLPSARPYNILVGHMVAVGSAFLALFALGALHAPSIVKEGHPVYLRMWASILAVVFTMLFNSLLRSHHPPSAATTLLVSIGAFPSTQATPLNIFVAVLLVTVFGEIARRARLGKEAKSPREEIPWRIPLLDRLLP